jgi:CxxC motif-containing protein (DUF1111 family)
METASVAERENSICLKCHNPFQYHKWLPSSEAHFSYVECVVCHAPDVPRHINLKFFDLGTNKFYGCDDLLAIMGIDYDEFMPTIDKNKDGISGKANRVLNNKLGRYNWKANAPTVKYQVAAAMHNDMGLTTPIFPNENCTKVQKECLDSPKGRDEYDIPMKRLDAITFYLKHLKTPKTKENKSGLKIFKQLSCASCHIPTFKLDDGKIIHPFSDLLLHDMGKDLADGRVEFQATGSEFKTPPLWGISIYKNILKDRVNFLHDGRAKTLQEAILWHSGEAEKSKNNFIKLAPNKRKILIDFLERL